MNLPPHIAKARAMAKAKPPRFVEIPRATRNTVVHGCPEATRHYRKQRNMLTTTELLEDEHARLCRTWSRP